MEAQCLSLDRISTLPPPIIEDILCRLRSIQEAVRTSILSKEWRYKWTEIPKLVFKEFWFQQSTDGPWSEISNEEEANEMKKMDLQFKVFDAIYQFLIMHQGPIHEFTLIMELDRNCVDLDNIISYLSRKHAVKKLTFHLFDEQGFYYLVPLSIFSLRQLTSLYLQGCDLNHQPTFNGFGNLTTLCLKEVYIPDKSLLHLLSKCPLLKDCTLVLSDKHIICENNCTIIELFQCLPAVERLTTCDWILDCFHYDQESITKERPISQFNLKYFSLTYLDGMVEIVDFDNLKPEFEFVKFILATSPELEKVHLCFDGSGINEDVKSGLLRSFLRSPPASPAVKIILTDDHYNFWPN